MDVALDTVAPLAAYGSKVEYTRVLLLVLDFQLFISSDRLSRRVQEQGADEDPLPRKCGQH